MKKGEDYAVLKNAGLAVPLYGIFDSSCLSAKKNELKRCVEEIFTKGSGLIGVRTEPKEDRSPLGNYPHYLPLHNFDEVYNAISRNEKEHGRYEWWYLVNEAFTDYEWNAVIKLTKDGSLPGYWTLDGEVNVTDNLPLRPALDDVKHVSPV